MSDRKDKINYYLDIAETVLSRSTCLRRRYGAVLVKDDQLVSSGYSGAPRGRVNCTDLNHCRREELGVKRGERYELCRAVHAESNAIIHASRNDTMESTLYLVGKEKSTETYVENASACEMCKRQIINAGIKTVIIRDTATEYHVVDVYNRWVLEDDSLGEGVGY